MYRDLALSLSLPFSRTHISLVHTHACGELHGQRKQQQHASYSESWYARIPCELISSKITIK